MILLIIWLAVSVFSVTLVNIAEIKDTLRKSMVKGNTIPVLKNAESGINHELTYYALKNNSSDVINTVNHKDISEAQSNAACIIGNIA